MNRKFLGLAPLLAVVAFALMPAAAQAAPHWWQNGLLVEEGAKPGQEFIGWGNLSLSNANTGELECQNAVGGNAENPLGGGVGVGKLSIFSPYNCVAAGCPAAAGLEITSTPNTLPWPLTLEEKAGKIRAKISNIKLTIKCEKIAEPEKGKILLLDEFKGELNVGVKNGSGIGSKPSTFEFDGTSGALESALGPGTAGGKVKVMGYTEQQIVQAKNP